MIGQTNAVNPAILDPTFMANGILPRHSTPTRDPHLQYTHQRHSPSTPTEQMRPPHPPNQPMFPNHYQFPLPPQGYYQHPPFVYDMNTITGLSKGLPSTESIPKLTGRENFRAWFEALESAALSANVYPHIASEPSEGAPYDPISIPTYPPSVAPDSPPHVLAFYQQWWQKDNVASHLVTAKLSDTIRLQIPTKSLNRRMPAREILREVQKIYGVVDYTSALVLVSEITNLTCNGEKKLSVDSYISTWRSKFNTLIQSSYNPDGRVLAQNFLLGFPSDDIDWKIWAARHMHFLETDSP
ncbi:hypothetical protein CC1G_02436 [Coprinopsis cinerea okayama7|uniref:Uncharacterized protein n=1 Tax=Coprinopsis cinerea (strain Okayama-7 / 130 / ATCC MYA-4618 / FGSC 9003) TaxID=240176 RepID=A8NBH6_COPC7|nr:hypothetical protein CC1G_02436 [Coprinopsis cinerea okayama7\|eukprot:XP_001832174.2 hypothetical protein CC1G_02436 [Coprinopsis cinerea okayama7\